METYKGLRNEDAWIEKLWYWADENDIPETTLPRKKNKLLELTDLRFDYKDFTFVPKEICYLTSLTSLCFFYCNNLKELPNEIDKLVNLEDICIFGGEITHLPVQICKLTNLYRLQIAETSLEKLPICIGRLTKLEKLFLGSDFDLFAGNRLSVIPDSIGNLINLESLSLNENILNKLPSSIGNLTKLLDLEISANIFDKIPEEITQLLNLTELSISSNLNLTSKQKIWIKYLRVQGCNILFDEDLVMDIEKVEKLFEPKDLIESLALTFYDYRIEEGLNPTYEIIEKWINQFSKENRKAILFEMNHIFKKMYISKKTVDSFLSSLVMDGDIFGNDPWEYWMTTSILNIQEDGESQNVMVEAVVALLETEDEGHIDASVNDYSKKHFLYIDDILFSGKKLQTDLTNFMKKAPKDARLDVCYMGYYSTGKYYISEKWLKDNNSKKINMKIWNTMELENRKACHNVSDTLLPIEDIADIPKVRKYLDEQPGNYSLRDKNDDSMRYCQGNSIFSSEENRQILEKEFTLAGLKINAAIGDAGKRKFWRPLGLTSFSGLGFGAMIVTYRNCPNNTPLALWWGDWEDNNAWTPLFLRKTYNRGNDA